jgi:signal transduction histidine kinase
MKHESLAELGSAAAGIAHDINNQLTLILNYLSVSDVDGARRAAARCTELTSGLLSWCRGETLRLQPVDVCEFLVDFADSLHLPDGVALRIEIPEAHPRIRADRLALTRMLTNLVSNACDAMHGEGSIVIRAAGHSIEVADSGPGVEAAVARRIFEPFFSTKGSAGTGLGLAIVRETMRQHGGNVFLRNEPRDGSKKAGAIFVLRFRGLH